MRLPLASAPVVHSFLAFDFGTARVGVASGNSLTRSATPLRTVAAQGEARFEAIARLIAEWQPAALVVGVPFHPDGAAHVNTERARRFGRRLKARFGLPVHEVGCAPRPGAAANAFGSARGSRGMSAPARPLRRGRSVPLGGTGRRPRVHQ